MYARKERATCERYFSHHKHYFVNPEGGDVQKWVPNMFFRFDVDPTINEFKIIILLR